MNGYNGPLLIKLWHEEGSLYRKGLVKEICNLLFFKSPVLEHVLIMDLYKKKLYSEEASFYSKGI